MQAAVAHRSVVLVVQPYADELLRRWEGQVFIGGAAASPTLIREVEEAFRRECYTLYGLTETCPVISHAPGKSELRWDVDQRYAGQAKAGFAIPGTILGIVDGDERPLAEDGIAVGEVVARGDGVMEGSRGQPELSAEVLRGGWLHTGDMGMIDANGYLQLIDRKKDIIISGGENISSLEVENTLLAHPAVLEVAAIPVRSERWGEVPRALVVLKPGQETAEAELILKRDLCAQYA